MNRLRLIRRNYTLKFTTDTVLPPFIGNTIRGAIGHAFDEMGSAAYRQVFKVNNAVSLPNPYAISAPYPSAKCCKKGDELTFCVTLFGEACDFDGEVIAAVRSKHMCNGKLAHCTFAGDELVYDRVWSDTGSESIPRVGSVTINFLSPSVFLSSKELVTEIDFGTFIDSIFGRICDITGRYTDGEFIIPYALIARRPHVTAEYNLTPLSFPLRKRTVNGILGKVKYRGDITPYLPYIDLGSQINIGKGSPYACGQYSYEI